MELDKANAELAVAAAEQTEEYRITAWETLNAEVSAWEDLNAAISQELAEKIDRDITDSLEGITLSSFECSPEAAELIKEGGWDSEGCYFDLPATSQEDVDAPLEFTYTLDVGNNVSEMQFSTVPSDELYIKYDPTEAVSIYNIEGERSLIVRIATSGEVTLGKDVSPEFAAHEFWHRLAEFGGKFEQRLEDLEEELMDYQDQVVELQELVNAIADAMGEPQAMEHDLPDLAAKMKDYLDMYREAAKRDLEADTIKINIESPNVAYDRAMKIVR